MDPFREEGSAKLPDAISTAAVRAWRQARPSGLGSGAWFISAGGTLAGALLLMVAIWIGYILVTWGHRSAVANATPDTETQAIWLAIGIAATAAWPAGGLASLGGWWGLRARVPWAGGWFIATILGWGVGAPLSVALLYIGGGQARLLGGLLFGAITGTLQWLVLRAGVPSPAWWPIADAVIWLVPWGLITGSLYMLVPDSIGRLSAGLGSYLIPLVIAWPGIMTAALLHWLLKRGASPAVL